MFSGVRISMSAGFALMFAALYFFDGSGIISALIPAVAAHETGHYLALLAMKARITGLRMELSGLRIDYTGALCRREEAAAAAAGPAAGALYAVAASAAGWAMNSDFLLCSSGISLVLSAYNSLPARPLDGGIVVSAILIRAIGEKRAETVSDALSALTGAALILPGAFFFGRGFGGALLLAGLWIYVFMFKFTCKSDKAIIK